MLIFLGSLLFLHFLYGSTSVSPHAKIKEKTNYHLWIDESPIHMHRMGKGIYSVIKLNNPILRLLWKSSKFQFRRRHESSHEYEIDYVFHKDILYPLSICTDQDFDSLEKYQYNKKNSSKKEDEKEESMEEEEEEEETIPQEEDYYFCAMNQKYISPSKRIFYNHQTKTFSTESHTFHPIIQLKEISFWKQTFQRVRRRILPKSWQKEKNSMTV